MKNNFSEETRLLFSEAWECWYCGANTAGSLHHIVGRGSKNGDVESSPLNACLVCNNKCHLPNHNFLKTDGMMRKMLNKTMEYLLSADYHFTAKDIEFTEKYSDLY